MTQGLSYKDPDPVQLLQEDTVYKIKRIDNKNTSVCLNICGVDAVTAPTGAVDLHVSLVEPVSLNDESFTLQPEDTALSGFYQFPVDGLPEYIKFVGNGGSAATRRILVKGLILEPITLP
jgi:hypothetical protein